MNYRDKISVLISNYNKSKFLKNSLLNLKKQNYKNFEIILFDDSSTDNSLQIIKKFKNVKLIVNKKKKSKFPALNQINAITECFKIAKGNIICLLDADDFFEKNKLSKIKTFFNNYHQANSVYNFPKAKKNKFRFIKRQRNIWPTIFPTSCISIRRKSFKVFLKFIKKKEFPNLEIDARFTIFSKYYNDEYNLIKDKLTTYNDDNEGIMSNVSKYSINWWLRRKQAFQYMDFILHLKKRKSNFSYDRLITNFIGSIIGLFN